MCWHTASGKVDIGEVASCKGLSQSWHDKFVASHNNVHPLGLQQDGRPCSYSQKHCPGF